MLKINYSLSNLKLNKEKIDWENINKEIDKLYIQIKEMIEKNNLEEAENLKVIIFKKEEEKNKLIQSNNIKKKKKTLSQLNQEHEDYLKHFNKKWKKILNENNKNKIDSLNNMNEAHKKQLIEFNQEKNNINLNLKENPLIKEFYRKKEILVKINQFKEAKILEKKIKKIQKEDRIKFSREKNKKFNELMIKLKKNHKNELNYLKNKLNKIENDLIKEKNYEYEKWIKKILTNKINIESKQEKKLNQIKINKNLRLLNLNKSQNNFPSYLSSISKNNINSEFQISCIKNRNTSNYKKYNIKNIYKY